MNQKILQSISNYYINFSEQLVAQQNLIFSNSGKKEIKKSNNIWKP